MAASAPGRELAHSLAQASPRHVCRGGGPPLPPPRHACRTLAIVSAAEDTAAEPTRPGHPDLAEVRARIVAGGPERYHQQAAAQGKLFVRDRIELLVDAGSFT